MSASLFWEPVERRKNAISIGWPSSFMDQLNRVFGSRTPLLRPSDIEKLIALRDVGEDYNEAYAQLIDAIEKVGEIQISAEY